MEVLWASWRSKYIQSFKDEGDNLNEKPCFMCDAVNSPEIENELLVVARREKCFVILNKYPYNGCHVLVAPYRHVATLTDLSDDEMLNIMQTISEVIEVLDDFSKPHGYNVGANLGRVAGAGVPGHIHFHIVPRWNGDTNFMSVLADTKIVSQSLEETQELLAELFKVNK